MFQFVRDFVSGGLVELMYVPKTEMMADIITKPLRRVLFENFVVGRNYMRRITTWASDLGGVFVVDP